MTSNINSNNPGNSNQDQNHQHQQFQQQQQEQQPLQSYTIQKTLGQGNFGKVKRGIHKITGSQVAIKILQKQLIFQKTDIQRISRQIKIMKQVRHPNIIQLYEIIQTSKRLYLIMQFADQGDLFDQIVSKDQLSQQAAQQYFAQLILGLEYLHSLGITHRDLKPQNLLLSLSYTSIINLSIHKNKEKKLLQSKDFQNFKQIKLADFGLGNFFNPGQLLKTACGSPCYAPPQMLHKLDYDPKQVDLWSCGIILHAMVLGYLPFQDDVTAKLYQKIKTSDFKLPFRLSPSCRDLIKKLLKKDPTQRISLPEVKQHQWLKPSIQIFSKAKFEIKQQIFNQICQRYGVVQKDRMMNYLKKNKHNNLTTLYYLAQKIINKQRFIQGKNNINEDNDSKNQKMQIEQQQQQIDQKTNLKEQITFKNLIQDKQISDQGVQTQDALKQRNMDIQHQQKIQKMNKVQKQQKQKQNQNMDVQRQNPHHNYQNIRKLQQIQEMQVDQSPVKKRVNSDLTKMNYQIQNQIYNNNNNKNENNNGLSQKRSSKKQHQKIQQQQQHNNNKRQEQSQSQYMKDQQKRLQEQFQEKQRHKEILSEINNNIRKPFEQQDIVVQNKQGEKLKNQFESSNLMEIQSHMMEYQYHSDLNQLKKIYNSQSKSQSQSQSYHNSPQKPKLQQQHQLQSQSKISMQISKQKQKQKSNIATEQQQFQQKPPRKISQTPQKQQKQVIKSTKIININNSNIKPIIIASTISQQNKQKNYTKDPIPKFININNTQNNKNKKQIRRIIQSPPKQQQQQIRLKEDGSSQPSSSSNINTNISNSHKSINKNQYLLPKKGVKKQSVLINNNINNKNKNRSITNNTKQELNKTMPVSTPTNRFGNKKFQFSKIVKQKEKQKQKQEENINVNASLNVNINIPQKTNIITTTSFNFSKTKRQTQREKQKLQETQRQKKKLVKNPRMPIHNPHIANKPTPTLYQHSQSKQRPLILRKITAKACIKEPHLLDPKKIILCSIDQFIQILQSKGFAGKLQYFPFTCQSKGMNQNPKIVTNQSQNRSISGKSSLIANSNTWIYLMKNGLIGKGLSIVIKEINQKCK